MTNVADPGLEASQVGALRRGGPNGRTGMLVGLQHATGCDPTVADLNCIPEIRNKVRFTIGDALSSVYNGGPSFHPNRLWYPKPPC